MKFRIDVKTPLKIPSASVVGNGGGRSRRKPVVLTFPPENVGKQGFMKKLILLVVLALLSGCETTSRTSERVDIYASYRPISDDAEITVRYSVANRGAANF